MHLHVASMTAKLVPKSLPEYSPGGYCSRSYINHSIVLFDYLIEWCSSYDEAQLLITSSWYQSKVCLYDIPLSVSLIVSSVLPSSWRSPQAIYVASPLPHLSGYNSSRALEWQDENMQFQLGVVDSPTTPSPSIFSLH